MGSYLAGSASTALPEFRDGAKGGRLGPDDPGTARDSGESATNPAPYLGTATHHHPEASIRQQIWPSDQPLAPKWNVSAVSLGNSPRGDAPIGEANLHAKDVKCRKSAECATAT
jgi:hypothetical protein